MADFPAAILARTMALAIQVSELGGPEVLRPVTRDPGAPGPEQVRVRVAAAGVNYIDIYFRTGLYPHPLPYVPGLEGAGHVDAVGSAVRDFAVGDRVAWAFIPASYSEYLLAPAAQLVRVPEAVGEERAAAAALQGMTAHYLVYALREPQPGDTALVHAAAGGTGLLLVQMLVRAGVRVFGTCSSEAKAALARESGADAVIGYDDFSTEVRRLTGGRGVDVVYDSVGQSTFDGSLASLRPRGLLALFGQSSGPVPPFDLQRLNNAGSLMIARPALGHFIATREELELRATAVFDAIATEALEVRIGERYPLRDAAAAQRALASRATTGKLLLLP